METALIDILVSLAMKYPWFLAIAVFMAGARIVNKPVFSILHVIAEQTPSKKDDEILVKVESSKFYSAFCWVLDLFASVKLKAKGK